MKANIFRKLFPDNRKKWKVFTVCLLTSSVFWLFLTFSRSDETTINFKIKYKNLPSEQVQINHPPDEINIRVRGKVIDLFNYSRGEKSSTVELDVEQLEKIKRGSLTKYFISLKNNPEALLKKSKSSFKVLSYSEDSIQVILDDVVEKKLPIVSRVGTIIDSTQYRNYGLFLSHDSAVVTGSKYLMGNLSVINTEEKEFKPSIEAPSTRVQMIRSEGVINVQPEKITLTANLEAFSTFSHKMEIQCGTCPDSVNLKLFPSFANVSFKSTKRDYEEITNGKMKIYVDYEDLSLNPEKLQLKVSDIPAGVSDLKLEQARVDYLLSTK